MKNQEKDETQDNYINVNSISFTSIFLQLLYIFLLEINAKQQRAEEAFVKTARRKLRLVDDFFCFSFLKCI